MKRGSTITEDEMNLLANLTSTVRGLRIIGAEAMEMNIIKSTLPQLNESSALTLCLQHNGWQLCKVPYLLGIPLVVKHIRPFFSTTVTTARTAIRVIIEPIDGIPAAEWIRDSSLGIGTLLFARLDGFPFNLSHYIMLDEYIYYHLLPKYTIGTNPPPAHALLSTHEYSNFLANRSVAGCSIQLHHPRVLLSHFHELHYLNQTRTNENHSFIP